MPCMPFKGWAVFSRSSRAEWPVIYTVRATKRDAIEAWKDGLMLYRVADSDSVFRQRIADGSIRVGKVVVAEKGGA